MGRQTATQAYDELSLIAQQKQLLESVLNSLV
jgi:hypothetical protein